MTDMKMRLVDWLDDLCVRFIINLPQEELESVERICFQVEEAQWFYEDFVRPLDQTLPSLNLRSFCLLMFQHCPLLAPFSEEQHLAAFNEFLAYKVRVPVRGAIMLDEDMEEVVLVKGWKKSGNWSFPRGKINKDEDDLICAIREVYEETGYDLAAAGLVPLEKLQQKFIEVTMREQHVKLFVFRGVPRDTIFVPRTRKEISKVGWFRLADLPGYRKTKNKQNTHEQIMSASKLYMVAPFMQPLKRWIAQQHKADSMYSASAMHDFSATDDPMVEYLTGEENVLSQPGLHMASLEMPSQHHHTTHGQASSTAELPAEVVKPSGQATSAELKRLLSVGQSSKVQPNPQPLDGSASSNLNNLLAMLRQGSKPLPENTTHPPQAPRTPLDQIMVNSSEPYSPHYHHTGLLQSTNDNGPPTFPLTSSQTIQDVFQDKRLGLSNRDHFHVSGNDDYRASQPTQAADFPAQSTENYPTSTMNVNVRPAQPFAPNYGPNPSQRMLSGSLLTAVPDASQLPQPRLSNHAQNLLNAFRISKERPVHGSVPPQSSENSHSYTAHAPEIGEALRGPGLLLDHSRSREVLSNEPSAPVPAPPHSRPSLGFSAYQTRSPKPSTQQEALLKLFQKPALPKQISELNPPTTSMQQQAPFELPAVPSPHSQGFVPTNGQESIGGFSKVLPPAVHPVTEFRAELPAVASPKMISTSVALGEIQQLQRHEDKTSATRQNPLDEPRTVKILQREPTTPVTSATLSGPSNVPDMDTVKSKARTNKPGIVASDAAAPVSPKQDISTVKRHPRPGKAHHGVPSSGAPQKQNFTPLQILKRPSAPEPQLRIVAVEGLAENSQSLGLPAELKGTTPKPQVVRKPPTEPRAQTPNAPAVKSFQPQLLRRPKPESPPLSSPLPEPQVIANEPVLVKPQAILPTTSSTMTSQANSQKQALLSLFSKESGASRKASGSTVNPVSAITPSPGPPLSQLGRGFPATKPGTNPDHKSSLLSLFSKTVPTPSVMSPSIPATPASPSSEPHPIALMRPLTSTVSPLQTSAPADPPIADISDALRAGHAPSPITTISAHRGDFATKRTIMGTLNSTASSSSPSVPALVASSTGATTGPIGSQNPISPSDRGFLLNFLKGL